jgi:hypothetical protein
MITIRIPGQKIDSYCKKPETGMGFQKLRQLSAALRQSGPDGILVNCEFLLIMDLEGDSTSESQEPFRRSVPLFRDIDSLLAETQREQGIWLEDSLPDVVSAMPGALPLPPPPAGAPGHPPYMHFTRTGEEFYRLSAFHNDRRILPDGSVAPGTYATTINDLTVTPSGLAAVGRFALPSKLPACYLFQIIPLPGTPIYFGTVVPNYGFCGGGVEVYFPYGCQSGCARLWKTIPLY